VVNANVLATTKQLQEYGEVFNVGTGKSITIKNIASLISDNLTFLPERSGEVVHSYANIQKIQEVLNWSPTVDVTEWIGGQL
jgi:nucleoside-diphosphate-sugar epimerase